MKVPKKILRKLEKPRRGPFTVIEHHDNGTVAAQKSPGGFLSGLACRKPESAELRCLAFYFIIFRQQNALLRLPLQERHLRMPAAQSPGMHPSSKRALPRSRWAASPLRASCWAQSGRVAVL